MLFLPESFLMLPAELELNLNLLVRPKALYDLAPAILSRVSSPSSLWMAFFFCSSHTLSYYHPQKVCMSILLEYLEHFPRISTWLTSCHQYFISLTMASSVNLMSPSMSTTWLCFTPLIVSLIFIDLFSSAHFSPLEHKLFENRDTVCLVYHYFLCALEEYLAQSRSSNNICWINAYIICYSHLYLKRDARFLDKDNFYHIFLSKVQYFPTILFWFV